MIAAGDCVSCGAGLAEGQRYCLVCGERQGELALRLPAVPASAVVVPAGLPRAAGRRSFGAVGTVVLASGVLIGAAVGPALTPASFAATARQLVVVAGGPATAAVAASGGVQPVGDEAALADGGLGLGAPVGNVPEPEPGPAQEQPEAPAEPAPFDAIAPAEALPAPADEEPPADPGPQAPAERPSVSGTVVHVSHGGRGYAVATAEGQLLALHARRAPEVGTRLKAYVRALDNGTFKELEVDPRPRPAKTAKFHGVVTFADAATGDYTVSARGVSMLVHPPPPPDPSAPPAPAPAPPAVGTATEVEAAFRPSLEELSRKDDDAEEPPTELDLAAVVRSVDEDGAQVTVSADDAGESTATLTLRVPPELKLEDPLEPDESIVATATLADDGSLTLVEAVGDR